MSYQARRITIIVLIVMTLLLAAVSIFVAISIQQAPDEDVAGGTLPAGSPCDPGNDQCAGNLVCTPNDQGQNVCNDPGGGNTCPSGETCGRILAFKCSTLTASGECFENRQEFSDFGAAVAYVDGCGQVDTVCTRTDKLCGSFQVFRDTCISGETKYTCNTTNFTCVEDANGPFDTIGACQDECVQPPVRYTCDETTFTCNGDPYGEYETFAACDLNCVAPPETRYTCDETTYTCAISETGEYANSTSCEADCEPSIQVRYICNTSTFTCNQDAGGQYIDMASCQNNCIPQFCGQPCGGPNGTTCPTNHTCDPAQNRCVLTACLNDPTCTNNGCSLPTTAIYGDSRDYVIYGAFLILAGIAVYKLKILPQSFLLIGIELDNLRNRSKNKEDNSEADRFRKDRERFESRFKNS